MIDYSEHSVLFAHKPDSGNHDRGEIWQGRLGDILEKARQLLVTDHHGLRILTAGEPMNIEAIRSITGQNAHN